MLALFLTASSLAAGDHPVGANETAVTFYIRTLSINACWQCMSNPPVLEGGDELLNETVEEGPWNGNTLKPEPEHAVDCQSAGVCDSLHPCSPTLPGICDNTKGRTCSFCKFNLLQNIGSTSMWDAHFGGRSPHFITVLEQDKNFAVQILKVAGDRGKSFEAVQNCVSERCHKTNENAVIVYNTEILEKVAISNVQQFCAKPGRPFAVGLFKFRTDKPPLKGKYALMASVHAPHKSECGGMPTASLNRFFTRDQLDQMLNKRYRTRKNDDIAVVLLQGDFNRAVRSNELVVGLPQQGEVSLLHMNKNGPVPTYTGLNNSYVPHYWQQARQETVRFRVPFKDFLPDNMLVWAAPNLKPSCTTDNTFEALPKGGYKGPGSDHAIIAGKLALHS